MPDIKIINNTSDIKLSNKWNQVKKFSCRNEIVKYKGHLVQVIQKWQRAYSACERVLRVFLAALATVFSLGFALLSKSIMHLYKKKLEIKHYAIPAPPKTEVQKVKAELEKLNGNALQKLEFLSGKFQDLIKWHLHKKDDVALYYRNALSTLLNIAPLYADIFKQGCQEGIFQTEYPLETAEGLLLVTFLLTSTCTTDWKTEDLDRRIKAFPSIGARFLNTNPKTLQPMFEKWTSTWKQEGKLTPEKDPLEDDLKKDLDEVYEMIENDFPPLSPKEKLLYLFDVDHNDELKGLEKEIHKKENELLHNSLKISTWLRASPLFAEALREGQGDICDTDTPLESAEFLLAAGLSFLPKCPFFPMSDEDRTRRKNAYPYLIQELFHFDQDIEEQILDRFKDSM